MYCTHAPGPQSKSRKLRENERMMILLAFWDSPHRFIHLFTFISFKSSVYPSNNFHFKNLLSLATYFCFLPDSCLETPILVVTSGKRCLKWVIHDLSFYIPSSFACSQNCTWCELSISANSRGLKRFQDDFLRGLWEERSCSVYRTARHCSTVLMRKPSRPAACNKIH